MVCCQILHLDEFVEQNVIWFVVCLQLPHQKVGVWRREDSTCSGRGPAPPWWSSRTEVNRTSSDSSLRGTSAAAWCSLSSQRHSPH